MILRFAEDIIQVVYYPDGVVEVKTISKIAVNRKIQ